MRSAAALRIEEEAPPRVPARRRSALLWLRKTHGWLGLWGAVLGLLFGATGILLNHRAVLKLPVTKTERVVLQLPVPPHAAQSTAAFEAWLRTESRSAAKQSRIDTEPARTISWNGTEVAQPPRWKLTLDDPRRTVVAEYYVGAPSARVERFDATAVGLLTRLHRSVGVDAFWVLLADTVAGSFIALSVTGLLLWTRFNRVRLTALVVAFGGLAAASTYALVLI